MPYDTIQRMNATASTPMPKRNAGFTLLEVLVALAVLAVALGALVRAGADSAGNLTYLRDKTFAHWVAMNRIVELRLAEEWPATGTRSGRAEMGGREWRWQAEVAETDDRAIRRVEVAVYPETERDTPLVRRTGFLPEPAS